MCARADISSDSIEESRAACEGAGTVAGSCHYNTGWSVHREWHSINTGV